MITVALAGNPNCGKTTLFNSLTGATAHVGNWPGVTVEKRSGIYKGKKKEEGIEVIDLPGIYSLSPYTPEEVISRDYILKEHPDVVINVLDGTNLERNLYMTTQILEMDVPVVVAINMVDAVKQAGQSIDVKALEKALGVPVVEISALHASGLKELMKKAAEVASNKRKGSTLMKLDVASKVSEVYEKENVESPLFHAIKALEKDEIELQEHPELVKQVEEMVKGDNMDYESAIADLRYQYLTPLVASCVFGKPTQEKMKLTRSDKIDKVLTNRWAAFPILIAIMYIVFRLVFAENLFYIGGFEEGYAGLIAIDFGWVDDVTGEPVLYHPFADLFYSADGIHSPGVILAGLVEGICGIITESIRFGMESAGAVPWVTEFICDGALAGVFAVLGFLPQILLLFLFFSILEDSGYMARVAFVLDRIFRKFGVSGRAFIPMIMGFGCGVPAMINTRTLASDKERTKTIRVIPFFTCGAKLPILIAIAGAIIAATDVNPSLSTLLILAMYVIGFAAAVISVIVMNKTTQREKVPPFIMELPSYHLPQFRALMIHVWDKAKHFVKKAFTIILVSTIVIWFMAQFTWDWRFIPTMSAEEMLYQYGQVDPIDMNQFSILAGIGKFIQPIFTPLGWGVQVGPNGWVYSVAAVQGLIAKENVVSTFGALSSVIGGIDMSADEEGIEAMGQIVSVTMPGGPDVGALLSFMTFNLLTIPCFASVATARGELKDRKVFWGTVAFWLAVSYAVSAWLYITIDFAWTLAITLPIIAAGIVALVIYDKKKRALEA